MILIVHTIGTRLKAWRELKKLRQPEAASIFGVKPSSYQKYEMDLSAPGAGAMECFVRAGINANWLLTGEGPMLLADLVPPVQAAPPLPMPKINMPALAAILEGALKVSPNAPANSIAAHCVRVYSQCIEDGLITPEGIGPGKMGNAA